MTDAAAEIQALEDRRWKAQLDADLATLDELLHDELVYTHSNGVVDGKRSYLAALDDKTFDYRSESRSDGAVVVIGDTAMATGRVAFHVIAGQGARDVNLDSRYSSIWVREGGTWRFVCYQSTPLPAS